MDHFRTEHDTLGSVSVPASACYGAQTQRSVGLFPAVGAQKLSAYPQLIEAMLHVKRAASRTNVSIGAMPEDGEEAISAAIELLMAQSLETDFPIHSFHGGGGIGLNMNVNEVLANLANLQQFGASFGSYAPLHPNDHINLNHSTSDCLSTACHIAARAAWEGLEAELLGLADDLDQSAKQMGDQPKLARTCLQDAVDIRAGDYFGGVAHNLRKLTERSGADAGDLAAVNLGGNIIGRTDDCDPDFFNQIIDQLNAVLKQAGLAHDLRRADNLFAASQAHNPLQNLASSLEQIARTLIRFGSDLRLMASGPNAGFGEIRLPEKQPGSSAIPGKINPTIPEFTMQCAMMACGRAATVRMTQDHGELDYNPWQMLAVIALLDMIALLQSGVFSLRRNCVQGLELNISRNTDNAQGLGPSLMQLKREFGYSRASAVAKQAAGDVSIVRAALSGIEENQ
jgi:aspartate ammonia-lyase